MLHNTYLLSSPGDVVTTHHEVQNLSPKEPNPETTTTNSLFSFHFTECSHAPITSSFSLVFCNSWAIFPIVHPSLHFLPFLTRSSAMTAGIVQLDKYPLVPLSAVLLFSILLHTHHFLIPDCPLLTQLLKKEWLLYSPCTSWSERWFGICPALRISLPFRSWKNIILWDMIYHN